jgi:CheY-like chemotaxis protein
MHRARLLQDREQETFMPVDQTTTLLLVEDDPGHARLIERNLQRAHLPYAITILRDGQAALDYVLPAQEGQDARHLPPCLVLLDLNLPGCSGVEVLARLKNNIRTKHIPVIILTTTDDPHEMEQCYALGCNAYLTKPVAYEQFVEVIQKLGWLLTEIAVPTGAS